MGTNLAGHGATGRYTTDNTAFRTVMTVVRDGVHTDPSGIALDSLGTHTVDIPAGHYRITDLRGFMGAEGTFKKSRGLRFRGAGSSLTTIVFDPVQDGPLIYNKYWQGVGFEGITFTTTRPGAVFMHSDAPGTAAQEYTFADVGWSGPWKYAFNLTGTDNNCEFRFFGCSTSGMADDGAFLHIGAENTSDQFLNYWFYGFKHWSTSAPLIDAARGGHFHLFGVDASNWGVNLTAPGYLLYLRGRSHSQGVTTMTAQGLRVEAKNAHAGLVHSEWPSGNVDIQCDWSSQTPYQQYGDVVSIDLSNTPGAVYSFHDSNLAGGVRVAYGVNAWERQHCIRFTNCGWSQRLTPSEAVSYVDPPNGVNAIRPAVVFDGCRGEAQNPFSAQGASVWDATVSHTDGALVKPGGTRSLSLRSINGSIGGADALTVNFPVGAIITGLTPVLAQGTWIAETSTGEHVATTGEQSDPFLCETREHATITFRETSRMRSQRGGLLTVEGYW